MMGTVADHFWWFVETPAHIAGIYRYIIARVLLQYSSFIQNVKYYFRLFVSIAQKDASHEQLRSWEALMIYQVYSAKYCLA